MFNNRPSREETEDDLLELQRQFLASKSSPSAQIVRPGEKRKSPKGSDQSDSSQPSAPKAAATERNVVTLGDLPGAFGHTTPSTSIGASVPKGKKKHGKLAEEIETDPEIQMDEQDTHITKVLKDIVEKDFQSLPVYYPTAPTDGGFPKVLHRGNIAKEQTGSTGGKKKSLFAQQFARRSPKDFGVNPARFAKKVPRKSDVRSGTPQVVADKVVERSTAMETSEEAVPSTSSSDETVEIHKENSAKLAVMNEREILEEQKKLLEMLDPSMVEFLKKRKAGPPSKPQKKVGFAESETRMDTSETEPAEKTTAAETMSTDDLPIKPSKDWVHMDKVESDKLQWLKDLPSPSTGDNKTGKPARFDFDGNLVASDADVPTHLGLHHHGNEPERAGYSLEELFHLCRSANMQQRVLALNTLSKIIEKARCGVYCDSLSTPLIPAVVHGGLLLILRWALDDATENTMAATVNCLHSVLVNRADEVALDRVFCWHRGHEVPCLCPVSTSEGEDEVGEEGEPTDAEILNKDTIKGLLKMSLLPRLRYVLEVWRPPPTTVLQILEILIRVARRSPEQGYEITLCPRLMDTVLAEFLPSQVPEVWPDPLTTAYEFPCSKALKLIRVICSSGRNMAANLLSHYPIMDRISVYIAQDKAEPKYHEELHNVLLESFRTWKILVAYGLTTLHYSEYYPMLMKKLQRQCEISCSAEVDKQTSEHGCVLLNFLESVTQAAANITTRTSHEIRHHMSAENFGEGQERQELPSLPEINWSHVTGLVQPVQLCLHDLLTEFQKSYVTKKYDLSFQASVVNFVASWLQRAENMPGYDAVEHLERLEHLASDFVVPVLRSQGFNTALAEIRHCSVLLCSGSDTRKESLNSLPEFGALVGDEGSTCPILNQNSTANFVLAMLRLLSTFKSHKDVAEKAFGVLLENDELLQYLRKLCNVKHSTMCKNHFAVFEMRLLETLLFIVRHKVSATPSVGLYHQMALYLVTHLTEGQELSMHQILSTVLFNRDFFRDISLGQEPSAASLEEKLNIREGEELSSATQRVVSTKTQELTADALNSLSTVRNAYLTAFAGSEKALEKSRRRCESFTTLPETFVLGNCGQTLVPLDWVFLPIVGVYNSTTAALNANRGVESSVSPAVVAMVSNTLRWVYLVESYRPGTLGTFNFSLKISRILCTFLAGSDLFLDAAVQNYLAAILKIYCKPAHLDKMDFSAPIPGLTSFYDLYMMLLDQYDAVSFGDSVFGCYMLLPLQQTQDFMLRKALWGERGMVLRSLSIPLKEVLIPIQRFLSPEESEIALLRLYLEGLFRGSVSPTRSTLFYVIGVHHVNRFMYSKESAHQDLRKSMIGAVLKHQGELLRHHLLFYKLADTEAEFGLQLYDTLPAHRQQLLDSVAQTGS